MIYYKQGEIVLIEFPFTSGYSLKKRPAVVISPNWYNTKRPDCIMAAISSVVPSPLEPDQVLVKGNEISQSGLLSESVILTGKIFTIESIKVIKSLGFLNISLKKQVLQRLQYLFKC